MINAVLPSYVTGWLEPSRSKIPLLIVGNMYYPTKYYYLWGKNIWLLLVGLLQVSGCIKADCIPWSVIPVSSWNDMRYNNETWIWRVSLRLECRQTRLLCRWHHSVHAVWPFCQERAYTRNHAVHEHQPREPQLPAVVKLYKKKKGALDDERPKAIKRGMKCRGGRGHAPPQRGSGVEFEVRVTLR